MFQVLGCLLGIVFFIFFLFIGIGLKILNMLGFRIGQNPRNFFNNGQNQQQSQQSQTTSAPNKKKDKVITDDMGEYVDYEEVKP